MFLCLHRGGDRQQETAMLRRVARLGQLRHASTARAQAVIRLPKALTEQLERANGTDGVEEIMSAKGPIFSTSVVWLRSRGG